MTKDEALKLALEALERISDRFDLESVAQDATKAITAIKEALAQPNSVHDYGPLCEDIAAWTQRRKSNAEERNFCPRCGKRLASGFVEISIHTCTPPKGKT